jgi:hypothetical protein
MVGEVGFALPANNGHASVRPLADAGNCQQTSRCSSGVEHFLGKEEVVSSILINGSEGVSLQRFEVQAKPMHPKANKKFKCTTPQGPEG